MRPTLVVLNLLLEQDLVFLDRLLEEDLVFHTGQADDNIGVVYKACFYRLEFSFNRLPHHLEEKPKSLYIFYDKNLVSNHTLQ